MLASIIVYRLVVIYPSNNRVSYPSKLKDVPVDNIKHCEDGMPACFSELATTKRKLASWS